MGIAFDLSGRVLRFTTTGDVEYADGAAVLRAGFVAAAAAGGRWHLLFDIRASEENRSGDEMRAVAALVAARRDVLTGRCVLVADDPLRYGLARMAAVYYDSLGFESMVCRSLADAEAWLDES